MTIHEFEDEPTLTADQVREIDKHAQSIVNSTGWGEINIRYQRGQVSDIRVSVNKHYQCYDEGGSYRNMA